MDATNLYRILQNSSRKKTKLSSVKKNLPFFMLWAILCLIFCGCVSIERPLFGKGHFIALSKEETAKKSQKDKLETPSFLDFRVAFLGGSIDDPPGKKGLTYLSANLHLTGGTQNQNYQEIQTTLESIGATLSVQVDKELTVFYGRVPKDKVDTFYSILKDVLLAPRFSPSELEILREEALEKIEQVREDDNELGRAVLEMMIYEDHPYQHLVIGTEAGIQSINSIDIKRQSTQLFVQNRLLVGVIGEGSEQWAKRLVDELKKLPEKGKTRRSLAKPKERVRARVFFVEKETTGTTILFGFPLRTNRTSQHFAALEMARSYVGEHRFDQGLLTRKMSELRWLNEGNFAYSEAFIEDGQGPLPKTNIPRRQQFFSVWLDQVEPSESVFALKAALYLFDYAILDGVAEDRFEEVRHFLKRYATFTSKSPSRQLGHAIDSYFYGQKKPYPKNLLLQLPWVTNKDVKHVLREHIPERRGLQIVIITPKAEEIRYQLYLEGRNSLNYAIPQDPYILQEDTLIGNKDLKLFRSDIHVLKASDLFRK